MIWNKEIEVKLNAELVSKVNKRTLVTEEKSVATKKLGKSVLELSRKINALATAIAQKDFNYVYESGAFDEFELEELTGIKQSLFLD